MKTTSLHFVFGLLVATLLSLNAWAQNAPGLIKAARVEGEVIQITAAGIETPLKNGDKLVETDSVRTGKSSSVILVFMNGATVRLAAGSKLKIEQFKMDPLEDQINVAALKNEPSQSKTTLDLAYGELVGEVKKLNTASTYKVKTPVGAAGIRGTTFRIVFLPTSDGKAFNFQVTTAEGLVVFEGTTPGSAKEVSIPANQEIVVNVEVSATGTVQISTPVAATQATTESLQVVQQVVQQVVEIVQQTSFTQTEQQSAQQQQQQRQEEQQQQQKQQPQEQQQEQQQQLKQDDTQTGATQTQLKLTQNAGG